MGWGYNDIYVLAPERSAEAALRFLNAVTPDREPAADEYQFPEDAEASDATFRDPADAIRYAAGRPGERQRLYFRNVATVGPAHAMVFFTGDGGMVLGVSVMARQEDPHREAAEIADWLDRLRTVSGAVAGYALYESPPPCGTAAEFVGGLAVALPPKLVGGRLVLAAHGEQSGPVWLDPGP